MTTTLPTSNTSNQEDHSIANLDYSTLPEKIKEYVLTKFEGFLIENVSFGELEKSKPGYILLVERGNLEVLLTFNEEGELMQINFDY